MSVIDPTHRGAPLRALPCEGAAEAEPRVPITRLDNGDPELLEQLMDVVLGIASSGAFTMGTELEAFEEEFAGYCGAPHAVGVSSGTEALALALRALEIGPGDEVIVPANSFIASAEAVSLVGATPRLVDVDERSGLITADIVERNLGPRVRCIIAVHLFGSVVDMEPILRVAHKAGVHVIEDTAQAHGARYGQRRVGTLGDIGCFSFYPTKNLGGWGDGGAIVTSDAELADRVRLIRSHGERPRYRHRVVGTTARLDALQAAVLRVKLRRLDAWNEERRRFGAALRSALAPLSSVELFGPAFPGADHVYHLFVVRSEERNELREHLDRLGVGSAVHYPVPIHRTEAYVHLGFGEGSLPVAERLAATVCSLPLFPGMSERELERVADAVRQWDEGGELAASGESAR